MPLVGIRLVKSLSAAGASVAPLLDADQQQVVAHSGGPLLVLAGPGTGKTTTLIELVVDRIATGTDPSRILLLTFGRRAAGEIRERLTRRVESSAVPVVWTFHGWCFDLLSRGHGRRPGLINGPEQDAMIRELLVGSLVEGTGRVPWPETLRPAIGTRDFADQMRDLISRARERSLSPLDVKRSGAIAERPDWVGAATIYQDYLDLLVSAESLDYGSLIEEARLLLGSQSEVLADVRGRYDLVIVDEYQDTDPSQVALLGEIVAGVREFVVIGDPDQSIYGFRGSDVRGILGFSERFKTSGGEPAPVATLRTSGRAGNALLDASRSIVAPLQYASHGLSSTSLAQHRALTPRSGVDDGELSVVLHRSEASEARWIADRLRRLHLDEGTEWRDMAVIVRGAGVMAQLSRALTYAGVPVEVAGDEIALGEHPAVRVLLHGLRCAAGSVSDASLVELLVSPLIGADPALMRRLGRFVRSRDRQVFAGVRPPRSADALIASAIRDPRELLDVPSYLAEPVELLAQLLSAARAALVRPDGVIDALWILWSGSSWPRTLETTALAGGLEGGTADASLDAVVALFSTVTDLLERRKVLDASALITLIEHLQIPGDVRAQKAARGSAVRLLTAHRSKGLEWPVVVIAGVQDGVWPDLRLRGSILEADRLTADGMAPAISRAEILAEERRLFYVAATRAKSRLIVTAVDGGATGERPSPFVMELDPAAVVADSRSRMRPARLGDLVASLRATAMESGSEALRVGAARQLAWLAVQRDAEGRLVCPQADPSSWWGTAAVSASEIPVRPADSAVSMSGSSLVSLLKCPLAWAYDHEARASQIGATPQMFGSVVHAIAEEMTTGVLEPTIEAGMARIAEVWDALPYDAQWESERERAAAAAAIGRYLEWHNARGDLQLVGSEVDFKLTIDTRGDQVALRGSMDRVEIDPDGAVIISDYKTGRHTPQVKEIAEQPQMGVYQIAVREGGLSEVLEPLGFADAKPGGADLVHLRVPAGTRNQGMPKTQHQEALGEHGAIDEQLAEAVQIIRDERFDAIEGDHCNRCAFQSSCSVRALGERVV